MRRLLVTFAWLAALAGCLESPPASGTGGDGGPGNGGPCGTTAALQDEFDGAELDLWRWTAIGDVTLESAGARISSAAGYANLYSAAHYQVSGSQLVAQVDVSGLADARFVMELDSPLNYKVGLRLQGSMLGLRVVDAEGTRTVGTAPLEREKGYWRLKEEDGQILWAQSADGTTWGDEQGPFDVAIGEVAHVDFELDQATGNESVVVQAVNPDETVPYCPASSFTDDFATPSVSWEEHEQGGGCEVSIAGQAVLGYSTQAFCALSARQHFDLRDSAYAVELADAGNDCKPNPIVAVTLADGSLLSIQCRDVDGTRKLVAADGSGDLSAIDYDADLHRFVQLRHDPEAGNLVFETLAAEGGEWVPYGDLQAAPGDLAHTSLQFYLGGEPTTIGVFEQVAFDSLNLAPN